jgi:CubicO group peptidase (beta-lactamase class C family)
VSGLINQMSVAVARLRLLLVVAGAALFLPGCVLISFAPLPDTVQAEVEQAVDRGFDGITVYVDQADETAVFTAGVSSRESQTPVEPDTLFKIASISKLYIAAATVKAVAGGVLSLDDTLAELMPELDGRIENSESITLRLMLQHQSGIPNFVDQPEFRWFDPPQDNGEALAFVLDEPAEFKPGRRYKYSNTNYVLIGEILDRTLGYSHHQYVRDEILSPLGLNNTYSLMSEVDPADVMSGYDLSSDDSDWKPVDYVSPGGSMIATAEDTGRFLRALVEGTLFTDEEQSIYSSVYEYEHTGLLPGYQSIARYHEAIDAVVVQFTNVSGGNRWMRSEAIYRRIVRILRRDG